MNFETKSKTLFYGMEFVNGFRRNLTSLLLIVYFVFLGYDPVKVTALFFVSRIFLLLFELPSGAFADHYSRKLSIIISFSLKTLSFLGLYLFQNFWYLSIAFILGDIGWSFQSGTTTSWIIDALDIGKKKKKITELFSKFFMFEKIGTVLAGILGFWLIGIEFRLIWLLVAIMNLITIFIVLKYMEERNFKPINNKKHFVINTFIQAKDSLKFLFKRGNRQIQGLALASIFVILSIESFLIMVPLVLFQNLGVKPEYLALLSVLIGLLTVISPMVGKYFADKHSFRKPLFYGHILIALSMVLFGYSELLILSIVMLIIFEFLVTAFSATIHDSAQQFVTPSNIRATLSSAMNLIWGIFASFSAGFVTLMLIFFSLKEAIYVTAVVALLGAIVYLVMLED